MYIVASADGVARSAGVTSELIRTSVAQFNENKTPTRHRDLVWAARDIDKVHIAIKVYSENIVIGFTSLWVYAKTSW